MVLSAVVFADVSRCRIKAGIAGVDEGASGDQVTAPRPALALFSTLFWGQWCCSCLAVVLPGVTCLGVGSSNAVLQPGRCSWCEGGGKGGGATLCWEGLVGSAAPVSAGGSLPVTGTVRAH